MTSNPKLGAGDLVAGRYRIESVLGQGGAALVYRVSDQRERGARPLALKRLHAHEGDQRSWIVTQFEHEYHTLRQLAHPRIIEVYDYGVDAQCAYYTMELLDGLDLQAMGKQPWPRACALLRDVASSLAIVHSRRLVHRDVSARNVRCTGDGRAKLIDFGLMLAMGVARRAAGTPPYSPPEMLEQQALDGRADLYGLGALAYFMLTGYHAYHARSFAQLQALWRSPPLPPRQYESEVPVALDQLVMELLQLERSARPGTAAEVFERLSGIAGLSLEELPEVPRSYLVMPTLVGRDEPLGRVRHELSKTLETGYGGGILVEGEAGVGRSRFLEACVVEAKLQGFLVLRADGSDAARGDYGVVRAVCEQLWHAAPELCAQFAARRRGLAQVLPAFEPSADAPEPGRSTAPVAPADRRKLQAAVQELLLGATRNTPLCIAIDDLPTVDEPSAALLGMLAHVAKHRRLILLTSSPQGGIQLPGVALLRELGRPLELQPLEAEHTEALLQSVFGDVDYVAALAERVHGLAQGNPRWTMTLLEHMVAQHVLRYEAGSWALAAGFGTSVLPPSLTATLASKLESLSPDARAIAETLALSEPPKLPPERYPLLCEHRDHARCYSALDELQTAGILLAQGDRFRFRQPELTSLLGAAVSPERARVLHARAAEALATCNEVLLLGHHLLHSGQEREGVALLTTLGGESLRSSETSLLELFETALLAAMRLAMDRATLRELRVQLVLYASVRGDRALVLRYAPELVADLALDAGLDTEPRAEPHRDCTDGTAILLGRTYVAICLIASVAQEPSILAMLPSLAPLAGKWPLLGTSQKNAELHAVLQRGSVAGARTRVLEIIERLRSQLELDPMLARGLLQGMYYLIGMIDAIYGRSTTGEWLLELQQDPALRANAARVRMIYELMRGHTDAATAWRRRAERLAVQDGHAIHMPNTTLRTELVAYAYSDNLLGVKRTLERLEPLAATYPGWTSTAAIGRAHYRRLQGDLPGALEALQPALRLTSMGRDIDWGWAAGTHLALVTALGDVQRTLELCLHYIELDESSRHAFSHPTLGLACAEALARAGRTQEARRRIDGMLELYNASGIGGLILGLTYESAARIALAADDEAAFSRYAELCAAEYKGGRDLMLQAKHERLMKEAHDASWAVGAGAAVEHQHN
jgi:hypothetical protein